MHRLRVPVPVIPDASDSFCAENTSVFQQEDGAFLWDSTLIKCNFLSPLCSWRLSQVAERKGNESELQEDNARPLGSQG